MRHMDSNRKLIKDEAWKDIHMTVPRRIVKYTINSMSCYLVYQLIRNVETSMMHFGYSSYFFDNQCSLNEFGVMLYYILRHSSPETPEAYCLRMDALLLITVARSVTLFNSHLKF